MYVETEWLMFLYSAVCAARLEFWCLTAVVCSESKEMTVLGPMFVSNECEGSRRGWEEQSDNFERARLLVSKQQRYVTSS
jgi:hypothetical protein